MTRQEPNIKDEERLPIGEAARLLEMSRDTLRKHTDEGYVKCIFNRVNKRRVYQGKELKRYWRAYC
jgi:DNA-binding transcriptional MerR regulator